MRLGELLKAGGKSSPDRSDQGVLEIDIDKIDVNPYQPRKVFDQAAIEELADSIAEHGVLQPVVVRPRGDRYELIVGERRLRACRKLGKASIPAVVKEVEDRTVAELALLENLQREDLHFLEEAEGLERLLKEFGMTQEQLGKSLGKSQSTIANKLRLLKLSKQVREVISREMISERHARALLKLPTEAQQLRILEKIVAEGLNVKQTEKLIAGELEGGDETPKKKRQTILRVYKDVRLFRNSVMKLVKNVETAGIPVDIEEDASGDEWKVTIRIRPQQNRGQKPQTETGEEVERK